MCCQLSEAIESANEWCQRNADHPFFFVAMAILIGSGLLINTFYIPIELSNPYTLFLLIPYASIGCAIAVWGPPYPFHYEQEMFIFMDDDEQAKVDDSKHFFCSCCSVAILAVALLPLSSNTDLWPTALLSIFGSCLISCGGLMWFYIFYPPASLKIDVDE